MGIEIGATTSRGAVMQAITEAAIAGRRCPTNEEINPAILRGLARDGVIKIEVFIKNWRVVTLMTGEHAGKMTAPAPGNNHKPYRIIYKDHVRIRRHRV